jgi:hypothetical protein
MFAMTVAGNVILNPDRVGMKDLVFVLKKRFFRMTKMLSC